MTSLFAASLELCKEGVISINQTKAFEKTSGQWTELIAARQKAADAGDKKETAKFAALINAGQEFLSQSEMSADQVEEFQKQFFDKTNCDS